MMNKYRKKPIIIKAVRYDGSHKMACDLMHKFPKIISQEICRAGEVHPTGKIIIKTLEGDMKASLGDWIIQGVKDELYPCKPDIFEMTYDPVEP